MDFERNFTAILRQALRDSGYESEKDGISARAVNPSIIFSYKTVSEISADLIL